MPGLVPRIHEPGFITRAADMKTDVDGRDEPGHDVAGRENEMPNPLAIDAHAHICTEETMKLLNKETPKVASA